MTFCLGQPSHPAQEEGVVCHICGNLVAGAQLGAYQIQQALGKGRSGNAYLATHLRSQQPVVMKLFRLDPNNVVHWEAVRRVVRATTALRHPSILPVYSCTAWQPERYQGTIQPPQTLMTAPGEAVYLLTLRQYVPGTLSHFIAYYEQNGIQLALRRHGIDPLTHLLKLVQQAASALSAAHARGIVHGGLVPGNMLVDDQEHLWIADFGLTRLHPPPAPYLAPELYAASKARSQEGDMFSFWKTVTPASDQYALAVLCQQLFSHLLRPMDYEHLLPVLQCATHTRAGQRFASIDIFVHELMRQARRSYTPPPASVSTLQSQSDMHLPPQQIIPPTPPSPVDDWEKAGGKLFMSRDYNGALKAYLNALELDSSRSNLWLALGDAYFALENYTAALRAYEQAVRLNPNEASSWSNRGTALDALGRRKEAMECYERADQLNT